MNSVCIMMSKNLQSGRGDGKLTMNGQVVTVLGFVGVTCGLCCICLFVLRFVGFVGGGLPLKNINYILSLRSMPKKNV